MGDLFDGKTCVVTGASTGIGLGLSRQLLARGATVWMCSRTPANIRAAGESLARYGDRVRWQVLDVRDAELVRNYVDHIGARGPIDYLFNNAGVGYTGILAEQDLEAWKTILDCNLYGVVHGVMAVLPHMLRQGSGHIVNTASVAGLVPLPYQSIYCASKYAVVGLSESLRYELEKDNVKVSVVCPAAVATQIFKRALDYSIHEDWPVPPEAISIDQAGIEILEGLEKGMAILPIVDFAREMHGCVVGGERGRIDATMRAIAGDVRARLEAMAPSRR